MLLDEEGRARVEVGERDDHDARAEGDGRAQRRAEAVAGRLTGPLGVDPARVEAVGYGEEQPIASNETAAGRAENRRVEARIQVRR